MSYYMTNCLSKSCIFVFLWKKWFKTLVIFLSQCFSVWGVKPGLTHSWVVGVLDDIQTFVLYIQTSFMGWTHTNPEAQIPSDQMLPLTGDRLGNKLMAITCSLMRGLSWARSHSVWEVIHALLWFTGIKCQPNLCWCTPAAPLVCACPQWKIGPTDQPVKIRIVKEVEDTDTRTKDEEEQSMVEHK